MIVRNLNFVGWARLFVAAWIVEIIYADIKKYDTQ